jgi:chromosome segregation ATPase
VQGSIMEQNGKGKNNFRTALWAVATLLTVASLGLLIWNYYTLEQTTVVLERNSADQAKNFSYVVKEYRTTKGVLDEANQKLVQLTQELEAANAELLGTRSELSSLQKVNDQMKIDIAVLERFKAKALEQGEALEAMIDSFKKKNKELDMELQGVRKELAQFQPDINDLNEGRTKVQRFKDHIRMVRKNMHGIKVKAFEAKVAAQKERDRVEALYGNAGFMVKDGENKAVNRFRENVVDIQVQFVNP